MGAGMSYAAWRVGKDRLAVGDPPRLRYTQTAPRTPNGDSAGRPWCEACNEEFYVECYCTGCKGCAPDVRGKHYGCYCYLNRQMQSNGPVPE